MNKHRHLLMDLSLLAGLASVFAGCAPPPRPPELATANRAVQSPAAQQAKRLAPQARAHADLLLAQANHAFDQGDLASSAVLAEQASAAYQRAAMQARAAQAMTAREQASNQKKQDHETLTAAMAETKRLEADIVQLQKMLKVFQDAPRATHTKQATPRREAARLKTSRALATDAAILCAGARLLNKSVPGISEAQKQVSELREALKAWPRPAPIDQAYRARSRCLSLLTQVRRRSDGSGGVGTSDMILQQLTQAKGLSTHRDDRGVVLVVRRPDASHLEANLLAAKQVLARHPGTAVVVVGHTGTRPDGKQIARVHKLAQQIVEQIGRGKASSHRVTLIDAAATRPSVHEPIPPPRPSQNERVEIIFIPPTT